MQENETKAVPFTLPSGDTVMLRNLTRKDSDALDKWVQKRFLSNVGDMLNLVPPESRNTFLLEIHREVLKLNAFFGEGRAILMSSSEGIARMVYLMIEKPSMTFERFCAIIFPDNYTLDSIGVVNQMFAAVAPPKDEGMAENGGTEQTEGLAVD